MVGISDILFCLNHRNQPKKLLIIQSSRVLSDSSKSHEHICDNTTQHSPLKNTHKKVNTSYHPLYTVLVHWSTFIHAEQIYSSFSLGAKYLNSLLIENSVEFDWCNALMMTRRNGDDASEITALQLWEWKKSCPAQLKPGQRMKNKKQKLN